MTRLIPQCAVCVAALALSGCDLPPRQASPPPLDSYGEPAPPACISQRMEQRFNHCPAPASQARERGTCRQWKRPPWPPALVASPTPRDQASLLEREATLRENKDVAGLVLLADELAAIGKLGDSIRIFEELVATTSSTSCSLQAKLVEATRMLGGDKHATVVALNALLDQFDAMFATNPRHTECGRATAQALLEVGDAWVKEGMGSPAQPGTADPRTLDLAEQLHARMLASFDQRQLDEWGVCVRLEDVAQRRAELLLRQRKWRACGPAFDAAIHANLAAPHIEQAALGSVICRQNAYQQSRVELRQLTTTDRIEAQLRFDDEWRALVRSYYRYMCVATRDAGSQNGEAYAQAAFGRAQAFYDAGAVWEGAVGFRIVAFEHSGTHTGPIATQRYAEAMEWLAVDTVCRDGLSADLERLLDMYCSGTARDAAPCDATAAVLRRLGGIPPKLH